MEDTHEDWLTEEISLAMFVVLILIVMEDTHED